MTREQCQFAEWNAVRPKPRKHLRCNRGCPFEHHLRRRLRVHRNGVFEIRLEKELLARLQFEMRLKLLPVIELTRLVKALEPILTVITERDTYLTDVVRIVERAREYLPTHSGLFTAGYL